MAAMANMQTARHRIEALVAWRRAGWGGLMSDLSRKASACTEGGVVVLLTGAVLFDGLAAVCEAVRQRSFPTSGQALRRAEAAVDDSPGARVILREAG